MSALLFFVLIKEAFAWQVHYEGYLSFITNFILRDPTKYYTDLFNKAYTVKDFIIFFISGSLKACVRLRDISKKISLFSQI